MQLGTGTFESTLDDKGRVSIPARLRERYSGELVITHGMQPSAWIMTPAVWEQVQAKLDKAASALSEDEYLDLQYQYVLPAQVVEIDKSGRIAVPSAIRKYARLNRECLVLSAENRLELWDAEFFWTYLQERRAKNQETMQKLGPIRLFNMNGL